MLGRYLSYCSSVSIEGNLSAGAFCVTQVRDSSRKPAYCAVSSRSTLFVCLFLDCFHVNFVQGVFCDFGILRMAAWWRPNTKSMSARMAMRSSATHAKSESTPSAPHDPTEVRPCARSFHKRLASGC